MTYPSQLSFRPESRVVLIGTSENPLDTEHLPPLPHARTNVAELKRLLLDKGIVGLPESCIVEIVDDEWASAVLTKLHTAAQSATDTLIVYYAGHGLYGDAKAALYLAAKNTQSSIRASAISIDEVKSIIRDSRATKRVLILDCCYSGRAFDGSMGAADDVDSAVDLVGTYGIAAVPGDYKAWAPPGAPLTLFTQALIKVLSGGIETAEEVLTLDDVFSAVKDEIRREAKTKLPERTNWVNGGRFRFARNRFAKQDSSKVAYQVIGALENKLIDANLRKEVLETKQNSTQRSDNSLASEKEQSETSAGADIESVMTIVGRFRHRRHLIEHPNRELQLNAKDWRDLPIDVKLTVKKYYRARLNALYLYIWSGFGGVYLPTFAFFYRLNKDEMGQAVHSLERLFFSFMIFFGLITVISFLSVLAPEEKRATLTSPRFQGNLPLQTALHARVVQVCGIFLEREALRRTRNYGSVCVSIAVLIFFFPY